MKVTYRSGEFEVTIEAPEGFLARADCDIHMFPDSLEEFEAAIAALGGLGALEKIDPTRPTSVKARLESVDPHETMRYPCDVLLFTPDEVRPSEPTPYLTGLAGRQREEVVDGGAS